MNAETQIRALQGLATALAVPIQDNDGVSASIVAGRIARASEIRRLQGFVYKEDGSWVPLDIEWADVAPHYSLLIEATCDGGADGWLKSLFQIGYPSGKTKLTFDHDDSDRWEMNPQAWEELPLDIRPNF